MFCAIDAAAAPLTSIKHSCLSASLPTASAVSEISAAQATASLWMRILCQHYSNGTWLFCLSPWLHFHMNAASQPHHPDWPPSWTNSFVFGVGGWWEICRAEGWGLGTSFLKRIGYQTRSVAFNKAHTSETRGRLLREKTAQERKKETARERWSCYRKEEQTEASHRGDGSRGCPWNCLTHYCSSTAMHGDGRLRESSRRGSDSRRVKDSPVLKPPEEHFKGWRAHSAFSNTTPHYGEANEKNANTFSWLIPCMRSDKEGNNQV